MTSVVEAIDVKYGHKEREPEPTGEVSFVIFAPSVGARQHVPSLLVLSDCCVECAGDEVQLTETLQNVKEIDLSHNQLKDWSEIGKVLKHAERVTFLNLGFNDLSSAVSAEFPVLTHMSTLILIGSQVSWKSVYFLVGRTPTLQELHVSLNGFTSVDLPTEQRVESVKRLMFDGNPVSEWNQVAKLGSFFPNLEHLGLSDCPIRNIPSEAHLTFPRLQSLSITNTLIEEMEDFCRLTDFPSLTEIRSTGIPFLQDLTVHERRQQFIALLPKIQKLNGGGVISDTERETAERAYVRLFLGTDDLPKRAKELMEIHGKLDPLVSIDLKPMTKVTLKIFCADVFVTDLNVNVYQTVNEFKGILQPLLGVPTGEMRLYYVDAGLVGVFGREIMRFPQKQLYSYNMRDGDEIHVD